MTSTKDRLTVTTMGPTFLFFTFRGRWSLEALGEKVFMNDKTHDFQDSGQPNYMKFPVAIWDEDDLLTFAFFAVCKSKGEERERQR